MVLWSYVDFVGKTFIIVNAAVKIPTCFHIWAAHCLKAMHIPYTGVCQPPTFLLVAKRCVGDEVGIIPCEYANLHLCQSILKIALGRRLRNMRDRIW